MRAHVTCLALALAACHGHEHAGEGKEAHGHGSHGDHAAEEEGPEPVALTIFTETHQMFVELDAPIAGKASGFHAHVTRLADHQPATVGSLTVEWLKGGSVATSAVAEGVARAGIFTPELPSPPAGTYTLRMTYANGAERAVWEAGPFELGKEPASGPDQGPEGDITFLMETQWKIPFRLEKPVERPVARPLSMPAVVAPDPVRTRAVTAPTAGRVDWIADGRPLVVGARVKAGEIIGRVSAAGTTEQPGTLVAESSQARIEHTRARDERERVKALVAEGLLPASRLRDAEAAAQSAAAAMRGARARLAPVRGGAGEGLPVKAPIDGVVIELAVPHGGAAEPGRPLATIAGEDAVLVRARMFGREIPSLDQVREIRLRLAGSDAPIPLERTALLNAAVVADPETQTAPLDLRVDNADGKLRFGETVELTLGVGPEKAYLTVPRAAVVEVNTRPFVFVMNSGEAFSRRAVRIGPADAERVAIIEGLSPADWIVAVGGFDVYVAALAGTVESHQH